MTKGFVCTSDYPVVETKAGKVRGFELNDIFHFYGMTYGTAKRWEMPVETEKWEGVKDALSYGYICHPLNPETPNGDLFVPHRFWPNSEDCLNLNVWTPSIDVNAKKAVMVWIHGGLYSNGSSLEMIAYDGRNLCEYGDVVVVSINHRLNVFGHLDVSAYGEKYWNSQNVGIADLVLALQWVHDNIAKFGGDPENVTVFGQSGGGNKIGALMQTDAANGLFHKAIIESGSGGSPMSRRGDSNADIAQAMLKELHADSIDALLALDKDELVALANKVCPMGIVKFKPCPNGWFKQWILDGSTDHAKTVPLLIGTCMAEQAGMRKIVPDKAVLSKEEQEALVIAEYGEENGKKLLELFYKAYPGHDPITALQVDDGFRTSTQMILDNRAKENAVTYNYMFAHEFAVDGGHPAWHCSDIPFVFRNIDKVAYAAEAGTGEYLQECFSNAFINFAKTGDPNNAYMPKWQPYTSNHEETMVIDNVCEARVSLDRELVKLHLEGKKR